MSTEKNQFAPTKYRIKIEGHLDQKWANWLHGLRIVHKCDGTTTLSGDVPDQTALHSILRKIRDLNLVLVSIQREEKGSERNPGDCGHSVSRGDNKQRRASKGGAKGGEKRPPRSD